MDSIYADAAAFGTFGFKQSEVEQGIDLISLQLSNELILHSESYEPAQTQTPFSMEDFIIIAEFSEVTGPIPLLTIPSHIVHIKDFDINNFIMQIMSVDYQGNPSCSGCFQTSEDVQVLQSEKGLHAYVHYTMLHDLLARGWVRPLCIAYISCDGHKLHKCFPVIRKMFLKMTQVMKYNNQTWFVEEILKVLQSFKEMQGKYFYSKKREEDGHHLSSDERQTLDHMDIDQMVHQYTEYKHVLHRIEPLIVDAESHQIVHAWKQGLLLAEPIISQVSNYISQLHHERKTVVECTLKGLHLRSILALTPWGCAAAIWILLSILHKHNGSYVERSSTSLMKEEVDQLHLALCVEEALTNSEYLSLLEAITKPLDTILQDHKTENAGINDVLVFNEQDAQGHNIRDSNDTNPYAQLSSGNEASSSYHSVSESFSDLPKDIDQSSETGSFLDISETFHTDDSNSENEGELIQENICMWTCRKPFGGWSSKTCGERLLKFLKTFDKEACHLLYALLIGRTVVLSGSENSKRFISRIISSLHPLVPVTEQCQANSLPWHCGILVSSHIGSNQLIGLCVPERLTVHDMISTKDKNSVTILDVTSKQLFGPAYSGHLLISMDKMLPNLFNGQSLWSYFQSLAAVIEEKVFVFKHAQGYASDKPNQILKKMGLQGCDSEIVKYFYHLK